MANFYWKTDASGSWSTIGNWSNTDGGPSNGLTPTLVDDVFLTSSSNANSTCSNIINCRNLNCTGYTGTLHDLHNLTIYGSLTLSSSMTLNADSTQGFQVYGNGTWTTNGKVIPVVLEFLMELK